MPSDTLNVFGLKIQIISVTFEGARLAVWNNQNSHTRLSLKFTFSSGAAEINQSVTEIGEHFISFHAFGFSGFHDTYIDILITEMSTGADLQVGRVNIYRLPLIPFYRDLGIDHHDAFFFQTYCGQYTVYGNRSDQHFPQIGIFLLPADVDQRNILEALKQIPNNIRQIISQRRALLYIDQSHEGNPFDPVFGQELHATLKGINIDADLVFFANHTYNYKKKYDQWVQIFKPEHKLNIIYSHWYADGLLHHEQNYFDTHGGIDNFVRMRRFRAFSGALRTKKFFSMNYTPRPHRVLLMLKLIDLNILDDAFVSFGGVGNSDLYKNNYFEMNGDSFINAVDQSRLLKNFARLSNVGTLTVDRPFRSGVEGEAIRLSATMSQEPYDDSYFSIVTESEMLLESDFQRVTEKVYKPLLRLHPMLVMGNAHTMGLLRDQGFMTFEGFFDEQYDSCELASERISKVFKQIDKFSAASKNEISEMYRKIWPRLEHNIYHINTYMKNDMRNNKRKILDCLYSKLNDIRC
ncbi:hypothetical protein HCU64_21710 [Methylobacterium sp. C25]|uniref:hypothetical protein n=1 Tax=Methylobacterium sp. C25 TaxID=2721622 RepID=UPI001F2ED267|nr:hypothetical protein [Methylobacterium sp. C25]MCE4226368.1 hypothetical protein [Methylobacterium sp. C25]